MLIFTDLDGCLLDKQTYSWGPARPALEALRERGLPLVLCSSKTAAEMRVIHSTLELDTPMICENGTVIADADPAAAVTTQGASRKSIQYVLGMLRGFSFRTFADLRVEGVATETGLSREAAERACQRQCTEPLQWLDSDRKIPAFRRLLEESSLTLTRGGRFWHVAGVYDKGHGVAAVLKRLQESENSKPVVVVGDSPIDLPMFEHADIGIVIPQPDGQFLIKPPGERIILAEESGPAGWNAAVLSVLA